MKILEEILGKEKQEQSEKQLNISAQDKRIEVIPQ